MSDLPSGWAWTTLGDVAESVRNGIFVSRPGEQPDGVPILRISAVRPMRLALDDLRYSKLELEDLDANDSLLTGGDLLFTRYSGSKEFVGACARVPDHIQPLTYPDKLIRAHATLVDTRYLEAAFSSPGVRTSIEAALRTTAGQVGISGSALKKVRFPLAPLPEQRRIVAALEAHLSGLDAGAGSLATSASKNAILHNQIITSHLSTPSAPDGDRPALAVAGVNDEGLPHLPGDWHWKRLGEIADVVGGITKDTKKQGDNSLREVPYLRVANVQRGRLDLTQVTSIRASEQKIVQLTLRPGDVLLNEGGDRDKLARSWVWQGEIHECIHQNHVFRARIRNAVVDPKILAWHANSFGQRWAQANGKQSVNLASISLKMIRLMPVPIPPIAQQQPIVESIQEGIARTERLKAAIEAGFHRAEQLRRSLLTEAFAGRLVPQDPTDEPASVLLDRIRAERAAQPKAQRPRRSIP